MYGLLFVVCALGLFVLGVMALVGDQVLARLKGDVDDVTLWVGPKGRPRDQFGLDYYDFLEGVFWLVLARLASRAGMIALAAGFVALSTWMAWFTIFHLGHGWGLAYCALALIGQGVLDIETKHRLRTVPALRAYALTMALWVGLYAIGGVHVVVPQLTIPSFTITLP